MKSILSLFLFLPVFAFAQNSIIVFPYTEESESFCDNYNVYNTKMAIQAIEEIYKYNAYNVIDTKSPMRKLQAENACYLDNNQIKNVLLGGWQSTYVEVAYQLHKTSQGNYFDLVLLFRDAASSDVLVSFKKTSKKRYSSNIKEFTHNLFETYFEEFIEQCNWAKSSGQKVDLSTMLIPSIAPAKKTDYSKGKKPKESKGVKEKKVTETVVAENFPLSDVDQNIPAFGKVNEYAVAVVIGNRAYRNKDVPEVKFARNDAKIMKSYLKSGLGFKEENIIYVEDATQADFNAIFGIKGNPKGKLFNYVKPNVSDVYIYYSGHGAPNPETNKGYFVPVDTDPSLIHFNGYSLDTFYENLGLVPYKSLTVIVDACFSGSSEGGMLLKNISPVFIKSENKVLRDENAVILTSAASEQVSSWYNEKYHSLFTYYYLKGLQGAADTNQDRKVSLGEMKAYIAENVPYMARRLNNREQTPEVTGDEQIILIQR
ncbi:DUF6175 family protein [Flammeovirga aprica]|uniref:Caspase family protein n=1 Tax=Flammeovirga aprica JL-4 TaxID=694437 RepID=A0A7X9P2U3_9BACT|nr:DUF6175 family protein [Flammeovirga aprica]NME68528.1 caspase family protein [Flammeovirga aprica JL-4]